MKKHKNLIDQEIQEALDIRSSSHKHNELPAHEDAELYTSIFKFLEYEPEIRHSDVFTKTIIEVAHRRKKIRGIFWKIALYACVSIPFIAISILTGIIMDPEIFWKMAGSLKNNFAYLFLAAVVFVSIQALDKILIKKKLPPTGT